MSDLQKQKNKSHASNTLDGLIDEAMDDISNKEAPSQTSFAVPVEVFYLVVLLLIVSVVFHQPYSSDTHDGPSTHALTSGKRVALLSIAEEIDAYQRNHNKFPKNIPGTLASVLQVEYKILSTNHYRLTLPMSEGQLVLDHDGGHEDIYLGGE